jgi:outer membrane lipoprotein carrier protein
MFLETILLAWLLSPSMGGAALSAFGPLNGAPRGEARNPARKAGGSGAVGGGASATPARATATKRPAAAGAVDGGTAAAGTSASATKKSTAPTPLAPDVKQLVDRMQAFYEKTQDFTADFEQQYMYKASKRKQTSTGKVIFKKPAQMRWEYAAPSKRTFVLAGDKVYMHDPEAMLLTKASIGTSQLSASVTFLWGQGKLADEFAIEKRACSTCAGVQLQLTPLKPDPRFKRILLEVDPNTAQVLKSTVIDPDGSENAITFKNLVTNKGVDADAFKLNPPEGTQVQDYTQASK